MKAERVLLGRDDLLKVDGIDGEFTRFDIGIGWLDPKGDDHFAQHWAAVIGQHKDGYYLQAGEASGSLAEIAAAAVDFKDRFLVERIWLDDTALSSCIYLQEWEGLTHYTSVEDEGRITKMQREREHVATLNRVPDFIRNDLQGCVDLWRSMVEDRKFKARKVCPKGAVWLPKASLEEILNHPLTRAITWPIAIMENEGRFKAVEQPATKYRNLSRK